MTTEGKTDYCIRILKHKENGFLAKCHLPFYSGHLDGRSYRRLVKKLLGEFVTCLKERPYSGEVEIKSDPTREEEFCDGYCGPSEKELARIRKALAKKIPEITFS